MRRPRSPGSGRPLLAGPQKLIYDGTVRISAPEYDATLSDHPEATLKYVDEEDGDIITVGSSPYCCHAHRLHVCAGWLVT